MNLLIKTTSAWLPFVMSLAALSLVTVHVLLFGIDQLPNKDEGVAARVFQLLLAGQLPIIMYFLFKNFAKKPKVVLQILAGQLVCMVLAVVLVIFLEI